MMELEQGGNNKNMCKSNSEKKFTSVLSVYSVTNHLCLVSKKCLFLFKNSSL